MTPPGSTSHDASGPSLTGATIRGVQWTAVSVAMARVASFLAHLALGWLLAEEDFAVYGLAISLAGIVNALRDAGASQILIQRGSEYDALAGPVAKVGLLFNLLAAAALAAFAIPAAAFFDAPRLPPLLWITAFSIPLNTPVMILRARLSIEMRFGPQARVTTVGAFLRHGLTVVFALLGLGPLSFVLPLPVLAIYQTVAYGRIVGRWPAGRPLTRSLFGEIFAASRWIIAGALATAIIMQGDYLVIGRLEPDLGVLGLYFFGFQLTAAMATVFTSGLQSVLMPALSRLRDDPQRQAEAYLRALRVLIFVVAPACAAMAVVADPLVRLLWAGKWDAAIPVTQIMAASMATRLLTPASRSIIEARGRWRLRGMLMSADAILTLAAAAVGAVSGGLLTIALWVGGYRFASGLVNCLVAGAAADIGPGRIIRAIARPLVASAVVGAGCFVLAETALAGLGPVARLVISAGAFSVAYASLIPLLMRRQLQDVLAVMRHGAKRRTTAPPPARSGRDD
jgi:O-antigen/teichoic acid export membrane protein